jgi:hypothetical protein
MFRANAIIDAASCHVEFRNESRQVILTFENDSVRFSVRVSDAMMADATGHFLRKRLFGLH